MTCYGNNNQVKLWDITTRTISQNYNINNVIECNFAYLSSEFSVGTSNSLIEYYLSDGTPTPNWSYIKDQCVSIDFDPTDTNIVAACNHGGTYKGYMIDVATGSSIT